MDLIPRKFYLDDIFDDMFTSKSNNMKCDIYEKNGDYHIEMDIPGFNKEDITVETKNGYISISAQKKEEKVDKDEKRNYIRRERNYGKFERSFYLGDLDSENIDAEFKNGMLKIVIPKKEETKNKNVIEIK